MVQGEDRSLPMLSRWTGARVSHCPVLEGTHVVERGLSINMSPCEFQSHLLPETGSGEFAPVPSPTWFRHVTASFPIGRPVRPCDPPVARTSCIRAGPESHSSSFQRVLPALPENGLGRPMLTFWSYNTEILLLSSLHFFPSSPSVTVSASLSRSRNWTDIGGINSPAVPPPQPWRVSPTFQGKFYSTSSRVSEAHERQSRK
jgi:hypothetical protein